MALDAHKEEWERALECYITREDWAQCVPFKASTWAEPGTKMTVGVDQIVT